MARDFSPRSSAYSPASIGLLVAIVGVALLLRSLSLGDRPFWLDEAASLWFARKSFHFIWLSPSFEPHPPLYYALAKLWTLLGESEATLRSLSVLFSTAALLLCWSATRTLLKRHEAGNAIAFLSAAFIALSPINIVYAQEARPYAMLACAVAALFAATANLLGEDLLHEESFSRQARAWLALAMAAAWTVWSHYSGLLYCAAVAGCLLFQWAGRLRFDRRFLIGGLAATALVLALLIPLVQGALLRTANYQQSSWLPPVSLGRMFAAAVETFAARWPPDYHRSGAATLLVLSITAAHGAYKLWRKDHRSAVILLVLLALVPPTVEAAASSGGLHIFLPRTFMPSSLPFLVLVAAGVVTLPRLWSRIFAAAFVMGAFFSAYRSGAISAPREPWREIAGFVAKQLCPGDLVVVMPNEPAFVFEHYLRQLHRDVPVLVAPAPYPAIGLDAPYPIGLPGTPGMTAANARQIAQAAGTEPGRTVFLLTRVEDVFDPESHLQRALARDRPLLKTASWPGGVIQLRAFGRKGVKSGC